jgi:hypothetical protein
LGRFCKPAKPIHELLRGRVVAQVASLTHGSGLSHQWMSFFFDVEEPDGRVEPIEVGYAFYHPDQLPRDSFWDYSKIYEMSVRREPHCDSTVESLAYQKNTDTNGNELPPSLVLRFAKGAPKDLLKREAVLPCYVLWYGDYRQILPDAK